MENVNTVETEKCVYCRQCVTLHEISSETQLYNFLICSGKSGKFCLPFHLQQASLKNKQNNYLPHKGTT